MMLKQIAVAALAVMLALPASAQQGRRQRNRGANADGTTEGKVLIVLTNNGRMGETDKPTGYWLGEVSHPWDVFRKAKYEVEFASPKGGITPADPRSIDLKDPINERFFGNYDIVMSLSKTLPLSDVKPENYEAIFFAGGHGTMWDFPDSEAVQNVTQKMWEQGKVVAAVCHGPAALVNVKAGSGELLVKGKKMAAFTDAEETSAGLTDVVPFLLESKLKEQGATVETAPNYQKKVVVDGKLVTGQNPASAAGVAEAVVELLSGDTGEQDVSTTATEAKIRKRLNLRMPAEKVVEMRKQQGR